MSPSGSPRQQRARAAQQQRNADAVRADAFRRQQRKQRLLGVGVVVFVVLIAVGAFLGARNQQETKAAKASSTTTTTDPLADLGGNTPKVTNPNPPVSVPDAPAGAVLTGATPCPAADGSSPRTTRFEGPPPSCLDPTKDYEAVITTTKGPIRVLLNAEQAPNTVNNFVVLSRYHYYDGVPVARVVPRGWMEFAEVTNADGTTGPGYTIAGEAPPGGALASPVMIAMVPVGSGNSAGAFLIGIGDQSPAVPADATVFGLVLDSRVDPSKPVEGQSTVQAEIDKVATQSGAPSEVVTITGITIEESPKK